MADPTPSPRPTAHRKPQNTNNLTHNPRTPQPADPHQIRHHTPKTESGHRPNHPQPHTQTSHMLKPAEYRRTQVAHIHNPHHNNHHHGAKSKIETRKQNQARSWPTPPHHHDRQHAENLRTPTISPTTHAHHNPPTRTKSDITPRKPNQDTAPTAHGPSTTVFHQPSDLRHVTTRKPPYSGAFACLSSDCYDHVMSRNRRHGRSLESVTPRRP